MDWDEFEERYGEGRAEHTCHWCGRSIHECCSCCPTCGGDPTVCNCREAED